MPQGIEILVHWIRPDGTPAPTKEEIAAFATEELGIVWSKADVAKAIRNTTITQETGTPQSIHYFIYHGETEVDLEEGEQEVITTAYKVIL